MWYLIRRLSLKELERGRLLFGTQMLSTSAFLSRLFVAEYVSIS
jgi:hypothetical protein